MKVLEYLFGTSLSPSELRTANALNEKFRSGELAFDSQTRVVLTDKGKRERNRVRAERHQQRQQDKST